MPPPRPPKKKPPTPYDVLGLKPGVSDQDVRKAFRKIALRTHPDKVKHDSSGVFRRLVDARDALVNPEQRMIYDFERCYPNPNIMCPSCKLAECVCRSTPMSSMFLSG
jgi:hypothetical protein